GRLRHFLHSEGTARAFADGSVATGHAAMGAKVTLSPQWLDVAGRRGDSSLSRQGSSGVVLIDSLSALHVGVKASQGSFSLPFDGWLLSGGERRSIEAATVAGDIRSTLRNIVACEGEPHCTPSGRSPHVWVEGLTVTGEA
ncbi:metallopeptidase TldD-related protein, partial [Candidatus Synechococcus spongiarum]